MNNNIFRYLKKKKLTDPFLVNSLFVSAYVQEREWPILYCSTIKRLLCCEHRDVADFIHILKENGFKFCLEDLMALFEYVISPSDRIVTGAVYTPIDVRKRIIRDCLKQCSGLANIRAADISCGCGGFLIDIALFIHKTTKKSFARIFAENIYGIDIQPYSVERTKILLSLLALENNEDDDFDFNIIKADTLDFHSKQWNQQYSQFDVIVGNPPYICSRNLSDETREKILRYEVCQSGHPDLYIPFFQIAFEMLKKHGVLGYITMNSFLRSVNGRAVRRYFSENSMNIKIIDFRGFQIFKSKSTYTCLFYLKNGIKRRYVQYMINEKGNLSQKPQFAKVAYDDLDDMKGWSLNDYNNMLPLEQIGTPIGKYCELRHGIATLNNGVYIFKPIETYADRYVMMKEGRLYEIEAEICRDVVNPNKLNSEVSFDDIIEKVIYPYQLEADGHIKVINEEIMNTRTPLAYAYLIKNRALLATRDKGKTNKYPAWYAFGRTQSLKMPRYKLFFPKFANKPIHCVLKDDENMLLYNGIAFVSDNERQLQIVKCIMESNIFWTYIKKNSKPYASGYYSLSGVYIKNFGVPNFTSMESNRLIAMKDKDEIENMLLKHYNM